MRINSLTVKNFKRIVEVIIIPGSNIVRIVGRNRQGKSSTLDAIWVAIRGAAVAPSKAIRTGADEAVIEVDLGEIIVRREFHKTETDESTLLRVESRKGARFPSPQKMLDKLFSKLTFDPLEFARMEPAKQFAELQKFVPGFDFVDNAGRRQAAFEKRTEWNRMERQERGAAAVIELHPDTPPEPVDEESIIEELNNAGKANAQLATRRERRAVALETVRRLAGEAEQIRGGIEQQAQVAAAKLAKRTHDLHMRIKEFEDALAQARVELQQHESGAATELTELRETLAQHAKAKETERDELQAKINQAETLPAEIDLDAVAARLELARTANALYQRKVLRDRHIKQAEAAKAEADTLTAGIETIDKEKLTAIMQAAMPVPGLGFGAGEILYNDLPFSQASDAERLRVSSAIAMAQNAELKVLRIRDGSLLDAEGLKILDEMAEEKGYQVWIEEVLHGDDEPMAWVIEAGTVKHGPQA
jgi:predicted ATP-dependent endonuclease of OLD family